MRTCVGRRTCLAYSSMTFTRILPQVLHNVHQPNSSWKESRAVMAYMRHETDKDESCNRCTYYCKQNSFKYYHSLQKSNKCIICTDGAIMWHTTMSEEVSSVTACSKGSYWMALLVQKKEMHVQWVYLVLVCGLALEGSGADIAGVKLSTHVGCQIAVGDLQEGGTVLRRRNKIQLKLCHTQRWCACVSVAFSIWCLESVCTHPINVIYPQSLTQNAHCIVSWLCRRGAWATQSLSDCVLQAAAHATLHYMH